MAPVRIVYFSDVLCVWAYIAQLRIDAVRQAFGDQVVFEHRFCSVFGDTARKIPAAWGDKGGYAGFNAHLRESAAAFPEIALNPDLWLSVRPASSWGAHLFLKAVQLDEAAGGSPPGLAESVVRALRHAFFAQGRDIGRRDVQDDVAASLGVELARIQALIADGRAFAALASDHQDAEAMRIQGSPSFVLNDGRQKLYGNVGFRILEANIQELLRAPTATQASWC
ncbi:MAG: DsbA family protein [Phenylobacterium sp.]|uniref:DsbA family oxidoreductase n=1 Tax=Phenylobacterium sp. TaxID=1871053 RepID=UPI001B3D24C6|nr:DsbA family protein [Phenylobacterium sp.]MBP7814639.1 DsbA family protein [Phenylobacterium sp.]MBP9232377.1 DsbA family protein [Phenylobacterium sp.]MBP9756140.1 DsbA family protein [Phenylobacterium sp.]